MAEKPSTGISRDDLVRILMEKRGKRAHEYVFVPEWGCTIKVVAMLGNEAEEFIAKREKEGGTGMYDIIAASCVDEEGNRLFVEPSILKDFPMSVLNPLQDAALKLNGFKKEAAAEAKKG